MATIVFLEEIDPIAGSRSGVTFGTSQAGAYAKKRPSPVNHQTTPRMNLRSLLSRAGLYYYDLTNALKKPWIFLGKDLGYTPPFTNGWYQLGYATFMSLQTNSHTAGDPLYATHPAHNPVTPPTWLTVTRIDKDTIRVTFNAAPQWVHKRIYLRQALPGPGSRRWDPANGYIAQYSGLNPNSPFDFTTHFQHITGWNGRYWVGCQRTCGCRSAETLYDL